MTVDRRSVMGGMAGIAGVVLASHPAPAGERGPGNREGQLADVVRPNLKPGPEGADQTAAVQRAIDLAFERGAAVQLPAGRIHVRELALREGSRLIGAHGLTTLVAIGAQGFTPQSMIRGENCGGLVLADFALEGIAQAATGIALSGCVNATIRNVAVSGLLQRGISLEGCSGRISDCFVSGIGETGIFSQDAAGLAVVNNTVTDCSNNGIQIWRTQAGPDGSFVSGNRIMRIAAALGGSGEYGNGVNVFRAGNVSVVGNQISDCAYTAIRGNAASNIQIIANTCARLGEVALYAEFGFEGAVISSNLVDTAATGIAVTNFGDGGRLAVVQGNLVRNLFRREHEPVDKRGHGIWVEADACVTGNTIENAATTGLGIGWGPFMRDVAATGNVIRDARVGIAVTSSPEAGACLIANNLISGSRDGAIRADDHGVPLGPDLGAGTTATKRVAIANNLTVPA